MPAALHALREKPRTAAARNLGHPAIGCEAEPQISRPLLELFARYCDYYLGRHFRGVHLIGPAPELRAGEPAVIFLNHASWWDPLVCLAVARRICWRRQNYAPIDATALERFRFFRKLGFFPVQKNSPRGAIQFLAMAEKLLAQHEAVLWITPQGDFVDQRQRPVLIKGGLAHLRERVPQARFIPLAIDYFFGEERLPGVALRFGAPAEGAGIHDLEQAMEATMDQLASEVLSREVLRGAPLMGGARGTGGIYGLWQRMRGR
jgi:1-acyl-sn-glycerol-3-phosphate acyltransferase